MTFHFNFTIVYPHILDVQRSLSNLNGIPCGGGPGAWSSGYWLSSSIFIHLESKALVSHPLTFSDKIRSRRLKPCLGFRWCSIFAPWCSCSFSIASSTFLRLRLAWEWHKADAFFWTGWKLTTPWPSSNRTSIGKSIGQNGGFHGFHGFQKCQDVDSLAEVGPDQGQAWSGTRTTELRRNQIF